jgi:hypothetical protein
VVGAFRFICNPAHLAKDDPIGYPGQPGKSHLHQFFGNTAANANSTYESLRTTGQSTCNSPLNRSAYWMPAMMNGKGQARDHMAYGSCGSWGYLKSPEHPSQGDPHLHNGRVVYNRRRPRPLRHMGCVSANLPPAL